jgi:hypothetical protein
MKRFEVWIDCEGRDEKEVRRKVGKALDKAGVDFHTRQLHRDNQERIAAVETYF